MRVLGVVLVGGGEPLLHPAIGSLIQALSEAKIHIGVVTNGLHVNRHRNSLSRADWVRVSLDAATAESYNRVRPSRTGRSMFARCIEGLEALVALKGPVVGVSFVAIPDGANRGNLIEIADAAHLSRRLGVSYFEVKALLQSDHQLYPYNEDDLEVIRLQLNRASSLELREFQIFASDNLRTLIDHEDQHLSKGYRSCPMTSLRTVVTPTGVYPCPYHRGEAAHSYGDPSTRSLREIWNQRNSPDPSLDCGFYCARHVSNVALLNGQEVHWHGQDDIFI